MFVIRDSGSLPITFTLSGTMENHGTAVLNAVEGSVVLAAFHIRENPDDDKMKTLVDYLKLSPVPISIVAVVKVVSSFGYCKDGRITDRVSW